MHQTLNEITFDQLLADQNPFGGVPCAFDLCGLRFISAAAMVQIAAACHALARLGYTPSIFTNDNRVLSYLARMGFISLVQEFVRFEPRYEDIFSQPPEIERYESQLLIELTRLENLEAVEFVADKVIEVLRLRLRYRTTEAYDAAIAVSEATQNTFEHGTDTCGLFTMHVYGQGQNRRLEIAIADYGSGLAATLRNNPALGEITTDRIALRRSVKLGVSQFQDQTRGNGLYRLTELTHKYHGTLQIRSGSAVLRITPQNPTGRTIPVTRMPGVQITLHLPTRISS